MKDPFVAEFRVIRRKPDGLVERDPEAFKARLKATEEKYKHLLVN